MEFLGSGSVSSSILYKGDRLLAYHDPNIKVSRVIPI